MVRIAICGSLDFSYGMEGLARDLKSRGFDVELPPTTKAIVSGKVAIEDIRAQKAAGTFPQRAIRVDAIRRYWKVINQADVILVANYDKKGIPGYIGGNSFLEMGFAHVLHKPIFLLNQIPDIGYSDEIRAMQPVVLHANLSNLLKD